MNSPSKYQSINDDVLEGRFAKQRCGEHQQGVEPTSGYTKTVHKVRGTRVLKHSLHSFFVLGLRNKI